MDDNQNPIRAHSQYSYQDLKTFQNFNLRRPRWVSLILLLGWILVNVYLRLTQKVWLVGGGFSFFLFTLLLVFSYLVFNGILYTKRRHAEATHLLADGFFYEFRENGFVSRNNIPDFHGQKEITYDSIYRVYDRDNMLYIYPKPKEGMLVDLDRVADDRSEELRTMLKARTKPRVYRRA